MADSTSYAKYTGLSGQPGVTSLNGETGAVTLVAGTGISITPAGQNITIANTGLTAAITSINLDTTAAQTLTVGASGTDFAIVDAGAGSHVFNLPTASASNRGALSSADWSTFNGKQAAGNYITALTGDGTASGPGSAAFTLATVNGNVGTFGSASQVAVVTVNGKGLITAAANTSILIAESQVTNLVSDLAGKQATGNYITALTGDGTASGPGSAALTLATVNGNVGSFGSASSVATFTVNGKGLITAAASTSIALAASAITSGTLAAARGGTNLDTSGSTGIPSIAAGTWSVGTLTGDVTSAARVTTVAAIAGTTVSGTTGSGNVAFSASPTFSGTATHAIGIFTGRLGMVVAGDAASIITIDNAQNQALISGATQIGIASYMSANSNGTSSVEGYRSQIATQAGSFTTAAALGYNAPAFSKGASSTITRAVNFSGFNQTVGANNAFIADNTAFTSDWFINQSGTRDSSLGGQFILSTAGKGVSIKEGSNAKMGTATLSAGTVVVSTTAVTATSRIQLTAQSLGTVTVPTALAVTARSAGTSFTILSSNLVDTSVVAWIIFEPS